jgi:hypothetical protein
VKQWPLALCRGRGFSVRRAAYVSMLAAGQAGERWPAPMVALDAFRAYLRRSEPRVVSRKSRFPYPPFRTRRHCWRLVPASVWRGLDAHANGQPGGLRSELVGRHLDLIGGGDACALRMGKDVFLPTIDGRLSASSVALAGELDDTRAD